MKIIDQSGTAWLDKPQRKFFRALQEWKGVPNPCAGITINSRREPDFITPTLILRSDERMLLSGEDGDGLVQYYGPKGYSYIHPDIEAIAAKCGVFLEWENPGAVCVWAI